MGWRTQGKVTGSRKTVTTAGTQVVLGASTEIRGVLIQAETNNTGTITIGDADVIDSTTTRTGIALEAGDTIFVETDNLADIWIDASVDTDGVTFVYYPAV